MKETGLMFKAPLVRAILEGRKTQTRRILKPQPAPNHPHDDGTKWIIERGLHTPVGSVGHLSVREKMGLRCPMGQPGDRIYVRETWADLIAVSPSSDEPMAIGPGERLIETPTSWTDDKGRTRWNYDGQVIAYRANSNVEFCDGDVFSGEFADKSDMPRWRPSIHMPKEFARIWLEITGVRVERLLSITEADAKAEGAVLKNSPAAHLTSYCRGFQELWESTGGDWPANPWVWVIDFKTISTTGRPA